MGGEQHPLKKSIEFLLHCHTRDQQLLGNRALAGRQYEAWQVLTEHCLRRAFGPDSPNVDKVMRVSDPSAFALLGSGTQSAWDVDRVERLEEQLALIESVIKVLSIEMALSHSRMPSITKSLRGKWCS